MSEFEIVKSELIDKLSNLTVLQIAELVKDLENRWGVSAQATMMPMVGAVANTGPVVEEKTEFDVVLTGFGDKKIQVIKEIRTITQLGLKEAKELVEGVPSTVKEALPKEEAEKLKKQLEEAGGTVEIK
jgi:large subunit ribosomal protein L7/L12